MNCQDIARILDDADFSRLTDEEQQAVKLHQALCPDCARDWEIQAQLSAARIPSMPQALREHCRTLVVAGPGVDAARTRSRWILAGTILVVAAAAASLGWQLLQPPPEVIAAPAPGLAVPAMSAIDEPVPTAAELPAAEVPGAIPASAPVVKSARTFTVAVLPLDQTHTAPASVVPVEAFHSALLQRLEKVPNLVLVDPAASAQYRITVKGFAATGFPTGTDHPFAEALRSQMPTTAAPQWRVQVVVDEPTKDSPSRSMGSRNMGSGINMGPGGVSTLWDMKSDDSGTRFTTETGGILAGECVPSAPSRTAVCADPAQVAATQVEMLRKRVFPAGLVLPELIAALKAPEMTEEARTLALLELSSLVRRDKIEGDTHVVLAIADLANAVNPEHRARIWRLLQGERNPVVIPLLLAAVRSSADESTSLVAMSLLRTDYMDTDPAVRAAIEQVARDDSRELVRHAAQRHLYGDAGWREYVVANLRNTSLSDDVRLAPLGYMTQSSELSGKLPEVMDDEAVAALSGMFPRVWNDPAQSQIVVQVLSVLSQKGHPGGIGIAADALRTGPENRIMMLIAGMTNTYRADPAVRKALDEASLRIPRLRPLLENLQKTAPPP